MSTVTITHSSGANATVYPYGATVTSYKTSTGRELLFVSKDAKLDGSKAIRGGIPLVFPQFGQPNKDMPQHGFLRCNTWKVGKAYEDGGCSCQDFTLALKDVVNARGTGRWADGGDVDCEVTLTVKVDASEMTTILTFKNSGSNDFEFQTLFHTYLLVAGGKALDKEQCNVVGLSGYSVEDKVSGESPVQGDEPVFIDGLVDRVFTDLSKNDLSVTAATGEGSKVGIEASAIVDGSKTPVSATVWNPHEEKAKGMGDFGDEQYHDMICVEPGVLKNVPPLKPGKEAVFTQVMKAL